jgi:hypothetical protein
MKLQYDRQISKNPQISDLINIRPLEAEKASSRTDGLTDRQKDMTKIAVFCNFATSSETSLTFVSACKTVTAIPV